MPFVLMKLEWELASDNNDARVIAKHLWHASTHAHSYEAMSDGMACPCGGDYPHPCLPACDSTWFSCGVDGRATGLRRGRQEAGEARQPAVPL